MAHQLCLNLALSFTEDDGKAVSFFLWLNPNHHKVFAFENLGFFLFPNSWEWVHQIGCLTGREVFIRSLEEVLVSLLSFSAFGFGFWIKKLAKTVNNVLIQSTTLLQSCFLWGIWSFYLLGKYNWILITFIVQKKKILFGVQFACIFQQKVAVSFVCLIWMEKNDWCLWFFLKNSCRCDTVED